MIFFTVGTHEQQFNRVIKILDKLKSKKIINDKIFIQTGYSDYIPQFCDYKKFISQEEMLEKIKKSKIIITHGGPSSFLSVIEQGKIPIVIPREKKYKEHVNNHQVDFVCNAQIKKNNIIVARTEEEIIDSIVNYDKKVLELNPTFDSNNKKFTEEFSTIVNDLMSEKL